ncbi:MAG: GH116 family glycosyl-hydrolase, partial [Isosphaeraceae bacterium]
MNDNIRNSSHGGCCGASRREFLQLVGLGALASVAATDPAKAMAGPFDESDFARLVPPDKKLAPEWVKSLFARGEPTIHHGESLARIGMPVGGICAGQLYLGGDGKLWHWDTFNSVEHTNEAHYAQPMPARSPLDQGFAVRIRSGEKAEIRTLDRAGFADIRFRGEYPIGFVEYRDRACPIQVSLEGFSPFIPLNTADSSLPATLLSYRVKNVSTSPVEVELGGWLENAICLDTGRPADGHRVDTVRREPDLLVLECSAEPAPESAARKPRETIVLADFNGGSYGKWTTEGQAFGNRPSTGAFGPEQHLKGFQGKGLVNTWTGSDEPRGKLLSPSFTIDRDYLNFLIGGGRHPGETCINLKVDDQIVHTATGKNTDALEWACWDVRDLAGKSARIEIVDQHSGGWGHINIDQIELADTPRTPQVPLARRHDFGTLCLALLNPRETDRGVASIAGGSTAEAVFGGELPARKPFGTKLTGALVRTMKLEPGQEASTTFAITWRFPNLSLPGTRLPADLGRYYATRFATAAEVAR